MAPVGGLSGVFWERFTTASLHLESVEILVIFYWKNLTAPILGDLN